MSPMQILAWVIVIAAIFYAATHQKKFKESLEYSGGFAVSVLFFLWVAIYGIPYLAQNAEDPLQKNYGPLFSGTESSINPFDFFKPDPQSPLDEYEVQSYQPVPGVPHQTVPLLAATPFAQETGRTQHTVLPGETLGGIAAQYNTSVDKLTTLNHIVNPDSIEPGQVLLIDLGGDESGGGVGAEAVVGAGPRITPRGTAVVVMTPTPTPTLIPIVFNFTVAYQTLATLKQIGGGQCPIELQYVAENIDGGAIATMRARDCALLLANRILREQPSDPVALAARDEIIAANRRLAAMKRLGERTDANIWGEGFVFAEAEKNEVDSLLRGYTYNIFYVERNWSGGSYLEAASLEIISDGWLKGGTFQLAVAHATRWGGKFIGDEFEVQ